ncbi:TPA: Mcm2-7 hexameric complex component [Trebouxia sp. C0006]
MKGELTRCVKPGDSVTITGIHLTEPYTGFKAIRAGLLTSTYTEAMHVEHNKQRSHGKTPESSLSILHALLHELSESEDIYGRLSANIAPEIFGHEDVKRALLLLIVGGVTRHLKDGMKLRGGSHTEIVKKQGQHTQKPSASHPPQHHYCKPSTPCEPCQHEQHQPNDQQQQQRMPPLDSSPRSTCLGLDWGDQMRNSTCLMKMKAQVLERGNLLNRIVIAWKCHSRRRHRRRSHQTYIISIDQFPQPQALNMYPSSRSHSLQVVMQAINEQAKQGSTERATLPQPHRRGSALPSVARDPHEQQAVVI